MVHWPSETAWLSLNLYLRFACRLRLPGQFCIPFWSGRAVISKRLKMFASALFVVVRSHILLPPFGLKDGPICWCNTNLPSAIPKFNIQPGPFVATGAVSVDDDI